MVAPGAALGLAAWPQRGRHRTLAPVRPFYGRYGALMAAGALAGLVTLSTVAIELALVVRMVG